MLGFCLVSGANVAAKAQTPAPVSQGTPSPGLSARDVASKPAVSERQRSIDADTEKLVQMAAELKVSVDKSNKNELSLDVIRKAEAVEKLAKSLKERIREAH